MSLAHLLEGDGDVTGAEALYRRILRTGEPDQVGGAWIRLAQLSEGRGDADAAPGRLSAGHRLRSSRWRRSGLVDLLNLLEEQSDLDAIRKQHQRAVAAGNPEAPYALVVAGNILDNRGDAEGARQAYQQAIDAGYEFGDAPEESMSPLTEPDTARASKTARPASCQMSALRAPQEAARIRISLVWSPD